MMMGGGMVLFFFSLSRFRSGLRCGFCFRSRLIDLLITMFCFVLFFFFLSFFFFSTFHILVALHCKLSESRFIDFLKKK